MLVLTRNRFESIHIGNGVVIKIIDTGRKSVKIGITAPSDVRILRSELCPELATGPLKEELAARALKTRAVTAPSLQAEVA